MEALATGYAEAIVLYPDGLVSDGSGQDLFLVRGGAMCTGTGDASFHPDITEDTILAPARDLDLPVREQRITWELLYVTDELLITGTAEEVKPVRSVVGIEVGDDRAEPIMMPLQ